MFRGTADKYKIVIEWIVNLFGLLYLGKKVRQGFLISVNVLFNFSFCAGEAIFACGFKIMHKIETDQLLQLQTDEGTCQPNTLIFGLPDGFYGAPPQKVRAVYNRMNLVEFCTFVLLN